MNRRSLLRGLAALAAGGAVAGCANNREVSETAPDPPVTGTPDQRAPDSTAGNRPGQGDGGTPTGREPTATATSSVRTPTPIPFVNEGFEWEAADDGSLVVVLTVGNETGSAGVVTVEAAVTVDGEVHTRGAVAEVSAGETASVRLGFPVDYEAFASRPSIDFDIREGRPATPFPTATPTSTSDGTDAETPTGTESG